MQTITVPNLVTALEAALQCENEKSTRDNSVLHVTDLAVAIGESCARQLKLKLMDADRNLHTAGKLLMFRNGQRIHEDLAYLLELGLPADWAIDSIEQHVEFAGIIGTADIIIRHTVSGEIVVVDFKSVRGRAFHYLEEAKPAHVLQVQSYSYGLDASIGLVLYVDREGQNSFKQFVVPRDDVKVLDAVCATKAIVADTELPPTLEPVVKMGKATKTKGVPVTISMPWNCDYCDYRDVTCHGSLPYEYRNIGVVGHLLNGSYKPAKELPGCYEEIIIQEIGSAEAIPF